MNGFGAKAYARVAVENGVAAGDPHRLILMLYDGVLESIRLAEGHMHAGRIADKGAALSRAVRIVDEGLKASLDRQVGGPLAQQLSALYEYAVMRLLQANLRNDAGALREVAKLLGDLRAAWLQIAGAASQAAAAVAGPAAARVAPAAAAGDTRNPAAAAGGGAEFAARRPGSARFESGGAERAGASAGHRLTIRV